MIEYGFEEGKDYCSFMSESTGGRPAVEYGFEENVDFTSVNSFTVVNNGAQKPIDEYYISIDMAKQTMHTSFKNRKRY